MLAAVLPRPILRRVRFAQDTATQTDGDAREIVVTPQEAEARTREAETTGEDIVVTTGSEDDPEFTGPDPGVSSKILDVPDDDDDSQQSLDEYWDIPISDMSGTPLEKLKQDYDRCLRVTTEDLDYEPAVYMREGSELLSQLRDQLVMLPVLQDLTPECKIEEADVGVPGKTTPEMDAQLRRMLEYHRKIFLRYGNAAPAPARGVVCDLDVGDANPVAQRPWSIAPHLLMKVFELLKKPLETGLIEISTSAWASPIVIVLKKNGVDIRMCIDYRVVNGFIKLSHYPLPLLIGFESAMWFISLDMASGFWAVRMTERAKLISAFICPMRHYQWVRMSFGLKNAPLIYQAVLNNCLWGFVRLSPEEEAKVDQDVLDFLGLNPGEPRISAETTLDLPVLTDEMTVFQRNIPAPPQMGPILGRSSYIDDIAQGAPTWEQLCLDLNALLFRLRYWNISGVQDLPFPSTLKGVQSFLGSLNYYNKFIEDLSVTAAVLYELTEEQVKSRRDLSRAKEAFEILKRKIVSTPLLRHPDRWAASAVLGQEYEGIVHPVQFTGRVVNDAELRYHIAEKEVIAILRVLELFRTLVEPSPKIIVHTRYSVLKRLLTSQSADGRTVKWGLNLSHWNLEIRRVRRDEDGLAAILGAGITPREHLDEVAENLIPAKGRVKLPVPISLEMLEADYEGHILSFDGAAKTSTRQGSCGCILWQVPGWEVLDARGFILEDVTVNDAEYHGLLKGLSLALEHGILDIVVVGDSRIAIQQAQGLLYCNQPNLQRKLAEYEVLKTWFKSVRLIHVKREFNQAADYLTSKTLALGESSNVEDTDE
ncbi:reverse transcriptase [Phytophthora cinnamomi]|uniref:reverse transcriptase n=1 Tax=Phytophthora cinnamomi TaxID=4785 RepID=UPI00355A3F4C|nr:reverse transcriptase [Phytophthora cinnamomi]